MPVQWVNRPHQDFRGFSGTIVSGAIRVGDSIAIQPNGTQATVARIVEYQGELDSATRNQAVTIVLDREVDASRGSVFCHPTVLPSLADKVSAHVIWMHDTPAQTGRQYLCKLGTITVPAVLTKITHKKDVNTMQPLPAEQLDMNEIGLCVVQFEGNVPHDLYEIGRAHV